MKKITAWAKSHKVAAIFVGAGAVIVAGFVLIVALGIVFVSTGMVEPEPVAQETEAVETQEPVKAETKAAPKTEQPSPKAEKKAEKKVEKPKPAPETEKAEKKPAEKPKKAEKKTVEKPKGADYKAIQKDLSVFFDCTWKNNITEEDGIVRVDICPEEDVLLGTGSDVALNVWADNVADDVPTAFKVVGDGYTVITGTRGQANQAWDMLGAEGEVQPIK